MPPFSKRKKETETPSCTVTSVLMRVVVKEISQILYKLENICVQIKYCIIIKYVGLRLFCIGMLNNNELFIAIR